MHGGLLYTYIMVHSCIINSQIIHKFYSHVTIIIIIMFNIDPKTDILLANLEH